MKTQSQLLPETEDPENTGACVGRAMPTRQALWILLFTALFILAPAALAQAASQGSSKAVSPKANSPKAGSPQAGPVATPASDTAPAAEPARRDNPVRLGEDGLPEKRRQLPDLGRLHRQLQQEAMIEGFIGASDRRHLTAVRAYVDRTGRLPDRFLQDQRHNFDRSRRTVQQVAKESMREYVKMRIGWDDMQDRMKVRMRNLFGRDRAAERVTIPMNAAPAEPKYEPGLGAIGIGPEIDLDMDDAEIGLDFDYDPGRKTFLSRWDLYYGRTLDEGRDEIRLRYNNGDKGRWFELTAGQNDREVGEWVGLSVTALF